MSETTVILRPLPDGWLLRNRRPEDLEAIVELMRRVYVAPHTPEAVWPEATLREHFRHFPEGQFSILNARGRLVADSTSMRVASHLALRPHRWSEITEGGTLASHDPQGDAFYGVDIAVDPDCRGLGLAHHLYAARINLAQRLGCRRFVAGARIPGYHKAMDHLTPEGYIQLVARHVIHDPTLSTQLRIGFTLQGLLPDYITDPESRNCAALIAMEF